MGEEIVRAAENKNQQRLTEMINPILRSVDE